MATVRASGIAGFVPIVTEFGGDPGALARAVGLDPAVLHDHDTPLDDWRIADLLDLAAAELPCPDLGLRMAARHGWEMLGPLSALVLNSATGAEAFAAVARYLKFHSPAISVSIDPDPRGRPGLIAIRYETVDSGPPPVQMVDVGMGFLHRAIGMIMGDPYGLVEVTLPYRPPADVATYREFYGVPVHVGRGAAHLIGPESLLHTHIAGANPAHREAARQRLEELLRVDVDDLAGHVRSIIMAHLGLEPVTIDITAAALSMHPRTLQRHLAAQGLSFSQLLDDARRRRAQWELTQTTTAVEQIAANVGFDHAATLTRAAHRWWAKTPRALRREQGT